MVVFTDGARRREGRVLLLFMAAGRGAHNGAKARRGGWMEAARAPAAEALCHSGVSISARLHQTRLVPSSSLSILVCLAAL